MKKVFLCMVMAVCCCVTGKAAEVVKGVSRELATERAKTIDDVTYDLVFDIPAQKSLPVKGTATLIQRQYIVKSHATFKKIIKCA